MYIGVIYIYIYIYISISISLCLSLSIYIYMYIEAYILVVLSFAVVILCCALCTLCASMMFYRCCVFSCYARLLFVAGAGGAPGAGAEVIYFVCQLFASVFEVCIYYIVIHLLYLYNTQC